MTYRHADRLAFVAGRTLWIGYVVLLGAALAWFAVGQSGPVSLGLYDHQTRVVRSLGPDEAGAQAESHSDIVIVGLDEDTLARYPEPLALWHSQLGRTLTILGGLSPRLIVLDLVLPDTTYAFISPDYDRALLSGIIEARKSSSLVIAQTLDSGGRARKLFAPIVSIAGEDSVGLSVVPADGDGSVRRIAATLERDVPTLYGRVLEKLSLSPKGNYINYSLGAPFSYVPMHELLASDGSPATDALRTRFADKIVLIGAVLPFDDRHRVPAALAAFEPGNRVVPGVLIQAQAARAALRNATIAAISAPAYLLLLIVASLPWWHRYSPTSAVVVATVGLTALYALGLFALAQHYYMPLGGPACILAGAVVGRLTLESAVAFQQRRDYERSFARYVSPDVLREILAGRIQPGMQPDRRLVTVLFSDIRGFTSRSEGQPPEATIDFLNEYFEEMVTAVHAHGGTIDKFIGDGLMAFFGAPTERDEPGADAFEAAKEMLVRLERLNVRLRERGLEPVEIGIGLHTGDVVIGHVGSKARHEYTVIGDTVNTASRLEGLSKTLEHPIVCSHELASSLESGLESGLAPAPTLTDLGRQPIKGHSPMHVFGWRPPADDPTAR